MSQNQYRMLNEIKELKSLINAYCAVKSFNAKLTYTFTNKGILTASNVSFEMPMEYENFRHVDYLVMQDIHHKFKKATKIPNLEFTLHFMPSEDDNLYDVDYDYDYGYYDEPKIVVIHESYEGYEYVDYYKLLPTEQEFINREFKPNLNIEHLFITIQNDQISMEIPDHNKITNDVFMKLLSHVESINKLMLDLNDLVDNNTFKIPRLIKAEPTQDVVNNFIKSYKKEMPKLKNYFNKFLKNSILESQETYLWIDRDRRNRISEAIVIEHIGYEFNWNSYPIKNNPKKDNLPKVHSYQDKSWVQANVLHENKTDLNGYATRDISGNVNGSILTNYVWSQLKNTLDENIFLEGYTSLKLSLTKGKIEHLQQAGHTKNQIYGFNKNNEIIFCLNAENEYSNNLNHIIKDLQAFKSQLNLIICELT